MRLRTYPVVLVQLAGLIFSGGVAAQATNYGATGDATRGTATRSTVIDMSPAPTQRAKRAPAEQPPSAPAQTPPRGMAMNRVVAGYGAPLRRHTPVGQPPITRWDYPGYRLYFEYHHVLHAVIPGAPEPVAHVDQLIETTP